MGIEDLLPHFLALGLVVGKPECVALTGGVASDIWLVTEGGRRFVVKRALSKLRVAADWRVPVSRNACEAAWLELAGAAAPRVIAHDPAHGFFVMDYLAPETHPVWKAELRAGRAEPSFAGAVGAAIVGIHAGTSDRPELGSRFNPDPLFHAIRLEPYLEFTATRHPQAAEALFALSRRTLSAKTALVHGDVSPKNILVGPNGPVFLDAECAWYGDPAFDLAFCLNHLLLKCLWNRQAQSSYLAGFDALTAAYFAGVVWERPAKLEARAASLLPALLLARVDGKSPVEYLTSETTKEGVRRFALPRLARPPATLASVRADWGKALGEIGG